MSSSSGVSGGSSSMKAGGGFHSPPVSKEMTRIGEQRRSADTTATAKYFQVNRAVGGVLYNLFCLPLACFGSGPLVVVNEGHRAAVLKFGKLDRVVPPGTYSRNIGTEEFIIKSIKIQSMLLPPQTLLTRDNVPVTLQAIVFYRIVDFEKAIFQVQDMENATSYMAQSILETVLGEKTLEALLTNRVKIISRVAELIDEYTTEWGIHIETLEIRDIRVPQQMERVMAATAEAQREGQAKVVMAASELKAAEAFAQAADIMSETPSALQLRYFQTLAEVAADRNHTILIPSEVTNMFRPLQGWDQQQAFQLKNKEKMDD
eukprot:TRINITY_DN26316_c0_g1_i1.p1 TRINITY_DN26316_c0_g1~~TRINITY_DN26316_c0_g1_i1.p1  ORF type:complete len:329 (-),score=97.57 TRINITY_DN26316_c0_g1_i1:49-1002(-)